jgi:hypothetical protein
MQLTVMGAVLNDIIENVAALRKLQPVWNSLLAKAWSKSVFLTWEWIEHTTATSISP